MLKSSVRGVGLPHPSAPSSVRSLEPIPPTPRSERMMEKLRDGLGEYVRVYNPVSSNWRRMNNLPSRGAPSGRHSVALAHPSNPHSRTGESADLVPPLLFERTGKVPRLHILHSDSESEDDETEKDWKGSVRSMPNLPYRGQFSTRSLNTLRTPRDTLDTFRLGDINTERTLSTISSDDEDNIYTSRRDNMRQALKLMGKQGKDTPRLQRKRIRASLRGKRSTEDGHMSDSALPSDRDEFDSKLTKHTSRASLDVITESQPTPEGPDSQRSSPVKHSSEMKKRLSGDSNDAVLTKKGSKASLQKAGSKKSLGAGDDGPLSKRNSVAALRARRRRQMLAGKFKRACRVFIILYRLWKSHWANVAKLMENFESLDALVAPEQDKDQLLFDLSLFKSSDEAKMPADAKLILQKKPELRTEEELRYLKIALRNYESIAEYPMHMQELISRRAWFEGYDQKRVMVREGHPPQNFYFILSGSVVVSRYDKKQDTNKTVCFMARGDSFGERAIINNTVRDSTVITKETSQFLVLRNEDYLEIFTSGGLGNPKDPFLTSLWYLRSWPLKLLKENPKKAVFSFFRRGFVLAPNTNESEWIYIVKSGSLSLYKKLKYESPDAKKQRKVKRNDRPKLKKLYAEHEDKLQFTFDRQISSLEHSNLLSRMMMQPIELNIPVNNIAEAYHKTPKLTAENTINIEKDNTLMSMRGGGTRELSTISVGNTTATSRRRKVSFSVSGPILTKSNMDPHPPAPNALKELDQSKLAVLSETLSQHDEDLNLPQYVPRHKQPMFVILQTLIKGSYFGLNALVYKSQKQPEFSLVSNGAEVIMIDKRFYEENCSQRLMTDLREQIYPFPMDDVLQDMLKRTINWDHGCKDTFTSTLHKQQLNNANVHDARSTLLLSKPPEMPPRPV